MVQVTAKLSRRVGMRPVKRFGVNKHRSARKFRAKSARTKAANIHTAPMRGGIRM